MTKSNFTFIFFFIFSLSIQAQNIINATVLDSISKQPIGFVNIGVLENTNGTVSDEKGQFDLTIKSRNARIRFSSIGYQSKTFTLEQLQSRKEVFLNPISYGLQAVQINAQKFGKAVRRGKEIKRKNTVWGWTESEHLGVEIGMRIKIKKESIIKSAHFGVHKNSADSMLFRVNIYDYKNGVVGKNLLTRNVFVYSHEIATYAPVDLSDMNLVVDNDVILTLETIRKRDFNKKDWLYFSVKDGLRKTNVFYRNASQAKFLQGKENKMGSIKSRIGFYLMVKESNKKKAVSPTPKPKIQANAKIINLTDSLNSIYPKSELPGFAITVVKENKVVYQNSFGFADLDKKINYNNTTTQPIGSVSKTFIAAALMKAIEQGHFTLETNINDILPFEVTNPHSPDTPIKVKHLVTHTSGFNDSEEAYQLNYFLLKGADKNSPVVNLILGYGNSISDGIPLGEYLKACYSPLGKFYSIENFDKKPAGTTYGYSNISASLAAYLIEVKTGVSYSNYVRKHIFTPLKMNNTAFDINRLNQHQMATLYLSKQFPMPKYNHPSYPDGFVNTSNEDLSKYLLEMINGTNGNGTILSKKSYQTLFKQLTPPERSDEEEVHSVFWVLTDERIQHSGGDPGVVTFLSFDPEKKSGYIVMTNINPDELGGDLGIDEENIFQSLIKVLKTVRSFEKESKHY